MQIIPSTYTVADYCAAMERQEIIVNRQYQRSDKVWPPPAKSFLIESVLLGFSIPKLSLYQVTDVKTRKTRKEIVVSKEAKPFLIFITISFVFGKQSNSKKRPASRFRS